MSTNKTMFENNNHPVIEKHAISKKQYLLLFVIIAAVIVLDQVTKYLITAKLQHNQSLAITSFFSLTYITNTGVSFGSLQGYNLLFIIITILFIAFVLYYLPYFETRILPAIGLVVGGATGNLIDRLLHGAVIDFLDFKIWPVFNVADSTITIAAGIIVILIFFQKGRH